MSIVVSYSDGFVYLKYFRKIHDYTDEEEFFETSRIVPAEWKNFLEGFKRIIAFSAEYVDLETTDIYNPYQEIDPEYREFTINPDDGDDKDDYVANFLFSVYYEAYQKGFQAGKMALL